MLATTTVLVCIAMKTLAIDADEVARAMNFVDRAVNSLSQT